MNKFVQTLIILISIWLISVFPVLGYISQDSTYTKNDSTLKNNTSLYNIMSVNILNECPYMAKNYAYKALVLAKENRNSKEEARASVNYANAACKLGDLQNASKYYNKAIYIYTKINNEEKIAEVNYAIGKIYESLEENNLAIFHYKQSESIALKSGNKELLQDIYQNLTGIYEIKNNFKNAFKSFLLFSEIKDSLFQEKNKCQIEALQEKYEIEEKMRQLKFLSGKNEFQNLQLNKIKGHIIALLRTTLLIVIISVLFIRQNRRKIRQKTLDLEQKLLRFQMNPHFVFNSLSSIQSLILKKKTGSAIQHLTGFSKLISSVFQNLQKEYISLESEIQSITHYLELQKVVLRDKLEYFIEVDTELDVHKVAIPPMLSQPLIENSILHGITHKETKGNIYIRFLKKEKALCVEIEDDGIGREKSQKYRKREHKSFATEIIQSRLKNINTLIRKQTSFEIIDLKNADSTPKGTKVLIKFPLKYLK